MLMALGNTTIGVIAPPLTPDWLKRIYSTQGDLQVLKSKPIWISDGQWIQRSVSSWDSSPICHTSLSLSLSLSLPPSAHSRQSVTLALIHTTLTFLQFHRYTVFKEKWVCLPYWSGHPYKSRALLFLFSLFPCHENLRCNERAESRVPWTGE